MIKIKALIKELIPSAFFDYLRYWVWRSQGCPVPPPHRAKQEIINEYRQKFGVNVLVETGTYEGETIRAQLAKFQEIISIEVSVDLYEQAIARFKRHPHVKLYRGDSGEVLKIIIPELHSPCLFWLDGHYSGGVTGRGILDTPIKAELQTIFSSRFLHVLLIDDARCFNGQNGYPTLSELEKWVSQEAKYTFSVKDDIIRLTPVS